MKPVNLQLEDEQRTGMKRRVPRHVSSSALLKPTLLGYFRCPQPPTSPQAWGTFCIPVGRALSVGGIWSGRGTSRLISSRRRPN